MRRRIDKRAVDALKVGEWITDPEIRGFEARRLPSGTISYRYRYRDRTSGRRSAISIGVHGVLTAEQARLEAERLRGEVADRRNPQTEQQAARKAEKAEKRTVSWLLDEFLDRYVDKSGLRTAADYRAQINLHLRPRLGKVGIYDLRRSELVEALDDIEDKVSAAAADWGLKILRRAFNWYAPRDDEFRTPIVPGMARRRLQDTLRSRILADDELRDLWAALDAANPIYARIVRILVLTGQRLNEVAQLRWDELADDRWTVPAERFKAKRPHTVPILPPVADLIGPRPILIQAQPFVFTSTGKTPFSGFSKCKARLDDELARIRRGRGEKPMARWVLHDLRRTARSLMPRAGVDADVAERVIGHALPGIRGVYDHHSYLDEKRAALERLGGLIERILNPPAGNVVPIKKPRRAK